MFERFTDTARRTVVLAQEEARMLNHNYIGTEHLFLALTGDKGPAGQALAGSGITRDATRDQIAALIGEGAVPAHGHIAFTPAAKEVLLGSLRIALDSGVSYINSEHLLLALLADDQSVAALAIEQLGISRDTLSEDLTALMTASTAPEPKPEPFFVLSA